MVFRSSISVFALSIDDGKFRSYPNTGAKVAPSSMEVRLEEYSPER